MTTVAILQDGTVVRTNVSGGLTTIDKVVQLAKAFVTF